MSRRPARGDDVFASTGGRSHLDAIQNGIQFHVAVHAQTSEFLNQRTKGPSCRGTIPQRAIQAGCNVVTHQRLPHTALALLEQYPYRSRPTLPTHTCSLRHALSICCDNAALFGGELSQARRLLASAASFTTYA